MFPWHRDVRIIMSSQDVIHSFFVPAFRVKADVLPGRYTEVWFRPTKTGTYHLFCAEYCGTQHSGMIGEVIVMEPDRIPGVAEWGWRRGIACLQRAATVSATGLLHLSSLRYSGPRTELIGVFGKPLLEDGRTIVADENYIRESILNPGAKIVSGFKPIMPTFQGQVSEENLMALVAYIKSLGQSGQNGAANNRAAISGAPSAQ